MLSCFINLNVLLAHMIAPIALPEFSGSYIACPSEAITFALLSLQQEEDPDEEPGKTVPPN